MLDANFVAVFSSDQNWLVQQMGDPVGLSRQIAVYPQGNLELGMHGQMPVVELFDAAVDVLAPQHVEDGAPPVAGGDDPVSRDIPDCRKAALLPRGRPPPAPAQPGPNR